MGIIAVDPAAVSTQQERMVQAVAYKLKGDYLFGVVDGTSWGDALRDFNIAPKKLPRVFVTVDDFEGWYEDIDLLQLDNIEADLRGLTSGEKQILRSSRSPWARLMFYKRELWRYMLWLHWYSSQGSKEAVFAFGTVVALVFSVMALGYCAMACCTILLMDEEDPYPHHKPTSKKKD